jgi:4-carboxymuconolactone decarboxylase
MRITEINSREQIEEDHRSAWDEIVASRGQVSGPFKVMLHSPEMARRVAHLGSYIRFESKLDPRVRELATLATARVLECEYEASAHEQQLRQAGASEQVLTALKQRKMQDLPPEDRWIGAFVEQALTRHRVDAETLAIAEQQLGVSGLVELTGTIGYYSLLAVTLNTFEVQPPVASRTA